MQMPEQKTKKLKDNTVSKIWVKCNRSREKELGGEGEKLRGWFPGQTMLIKYCGKRQEGTSLKKRGKERYGK